MNTCPLCGNPADKPNSHIIPFTLIKSMVTPNEKKRTEMEVTFDLSSGPGVNYYFGRDVIGTKIEELLGKEISEEESKKLKDPFKIDNLICIKCEENLGHLESLYGKYIPPRVVELKKSGNTSLTLNERDSLILKVFSYSIIWRLGITRFNRYELHESIIERLQDIVKKCLASDTTTTLINLTENKEEINNHKITCGYFDTNIKPETQFNFFDPVNTAPHCFYINGLTIYFYYKKSVLLRRGNGFFGLDKIFDRAAIFKEENSIIYDHDEATVFPAVCEMAKLMADKIVREARVGFEYAYSIKYGIKPPAALMAAFLREYTDMNYQYADKFHVTRTVKLIQKYSS